MILMMNVKFATILLLLAVAQAGCHSERHKAEPAPPPQNVTPGSTITVVKGFLIPSGDSSVYFQDTRLYPEGEIQSNYPFCEFVTGEVAAAGQLIRTGTFTVGAVEYDEQGVGPGGMTYSATELHLQETATAKSYRMNCMLPLLSASSRFVSPAEIQGAIGGYMNLKVAP